jgi:hypothetical protein
MVGRERLDPSTNGLKVSQRSVQFSGNQEGTEASDVLLCATVHNRAEPDYTKSAHRSEVVEVSSKQKSHTCGSNPEENSAFYLRVPPIDATPDL